MFVQSNGVNLCVETFGASTDPAVLLVHGACASMLGWERELCELIAARGRFVIRYDQRDTGLSTYYPPGEPAYKLSDLAGDAVGILDALGIDRAQVVGRSMSGAIALILGVDHPDRVSGLTFVATTTGDDELPPMEPAFTDRASYDDPVDEVVAVLRAYAGGRLEDEAETRALVVEDFARALSPASAANHFLIEFDGPRNGGFGEIAVPTVVVHGDRDPVFPLAHGEALRDAVPGARLVVLPDTGHEVPRRVWPEFVAAVTG
ncbi:alpha/beta hydrolase [Kribbella sp. NPDC051770]|uniref:alpha/beta fold hydrolase n=1 Tax=Kribbella sp. NPDC051770 TaxID=3155413 RepID=UPI0034415454